MSKNPVLLILGWLLLFSLSAGVSYLITASVSSPRSDTPTQTTQTPTNTKAQSKKSKIDPSIPRTQACPLNGAYFTEAEKQIWTTRRPLAVMIENHEDSRPLSGLGSADIVYEAIAEGGITRQMGVFYCNVAENTMFAPVRSARIYFTKLVLEYDALYNHVGGAGNCDDPTVAESVKALCFIRKNNIKDLDQFGRAGDFKTCHRVTNRLDHDVAYEHTMACYSDELYKAGAKYDWTNVDAKGVAWDKNFKPWKFKDDSKTQGQTQKVAFDFWEGMPKYSVVWQFDPASSSYLRENGGEKTIDLNTDEQISAKNVVIQFVKETGPLDEHKHMNYEVLGTGKAIVFQDGQFVKGTWSKSTLTARTRFLNELGKEIELNRGPIWIELLPEGTEVQY